MPKMYAIDATQSQITEEPNPASCFSSLISSFSVTEIQPFQFPPTWVATDRDQTHYGSGAGSGMRLPAKAVRK